MHFFYIININNHLINVFLKKKFIMLYQLPNGKSIEMSIDEYLNLNINDISFYTAFNIGMELENPFALSVLLYGDDSYYDDDLDEEEIEDLLDIDPEEKIMDNDFYNKDELEL